MDAFALLHTTETEKQHLMVDNLLKKPTQEQWLEKRICAKMDTKFV